MYRRILFLLIIVFVSLMIAAPVAIAGEGADDSREYTPDGVEVDPDGLEGIVVGPNRNIEEPFPAAPGIVVRGFFRLSLILGF